MSENRLLSGCCYICHVYDIRWEKGIRLLVKVVHFILTFFSSKHSILILLLWCLITSYYCLLFSRAIGIQRGILTSCMGSLFPVIYVYFVGSASYFTVFGSSYICCLIRTDLNPRHNSNNNSLWHYTCIALYVCNAYLNLIHFSSIDATGLLIMFNPRPGGRRIMHSNYCQSDYVCVPVYRYN